MFGLSILKDFWPSCQHFRSGNVTLKPWLPRSSWKRWQSSNPGPAVCGVSGLRLRSSCPRWIRLGTWVHHSTQHALPLPDTKAKWKLPFIITLPVLIFLKLKVTYLMCPYLYQKWENIQAIEITAYFKTNKKKYICLWEWIISPTPAWPL